MAGSLAGPLEDTIDPYTDQGPITGKFSIANNGSWPYLTIDPIMSHKSSSVMYAPNKILRAGGMVLDGDPDVPTNLAFTINLNDTTPSWSSPTETSMHMHCDRRGVNLVVLPDGKVFAANGWVGPQHNAVNIHCPEIWNPVSRSWTVMAKMNAPCMTNHPEDCDSEDTPKGNVDTRGDHAEAILLPDARVLLMGGEAAGNPFPGHIGHHPPNKGAQIFSPPYLFNTNGDPATRPVIIKVGPAKSELVYGKMAEVDTLDAYQIQSVSLIRLGTTTHGFDMDQRYMELSFRPRGLPGHLRKYLEIDAPANGNQAPPGYYMLFILKNGVPSVAKIVKLRNCAPGDPGPDCNNNGAPDDCDIASWVASDCNDNEIPDSCDIATSTSMDCDANGIPDECSCSNCFCPLGLISTTAPASPPHLTRDARQPHPIDDNRLIARQGIGSDDERITITMMSALCGNVGPQCFQLCETGIEPTDGTPMDGVALTTNQIRSVTKRSSPANSYDIVLTRPISAGHWTTIKYWSGSKKIAYASLPGDVNGDGVVVSGTGSGSDQIALQNCSTCSIYRKDIDHSGSYPAGDLIALADLFGGNGKFIPWDTKYLPSNVCAQGGGGGPYCPSVPCGGGWDPNAMAMMGGFGGMESLGGESLPEGSEESEPELDENAHIANGLAELLTESNPVGAEELALFDSFVSAMTQWVVENFGPEEKAPFAQWLSDPARVFASQAGQDAAAGVVQTLAP